MKHLEKKLRRLVEFIDDDSNDFLDDEDYISDDEARLRHIHQQIATLTEEALKIIKQVVPEYYDSAKSYWYGQIMQALGTDNYPSGHSVTLEKSIEHLKNSQ